MRIFEKLSMLSKQLDYEKGQNKKNETPHDQKKMRIHLGENKK